MGGEAINPAALEEHIDIPAYFAPEVMQLATDWWDRTTEKLSAFKLGEGPSPFGELEELLKPHGISDPTFIAELVIATRFKARETNSIKEKK